MENIAGPAALYSTAQLEKRGVTVRRRCIHAPAKARRGRWLCFAGETLYVYTYVPTVCMYGGKDASGKSGVGHVCMSELFTYLGVL